MGSEWCRVKLGEVFEVNPLRSIPRGQSTPFIPMDAISGYSRRPVRIDERKFTGSGIKFKNGDTLIARITPCLENGKTIFVNDLPEGVIAHGSTEYIVLRGKPPRTHGLFAYYLATSPDFRRYAIGHMEGTSGRQRVPSLAIEKYLFQLPSFDEQRAIAHILGTLDDKIELNRKMNETLEEMAKALFKSWFVDFEPVRAKRDGRWKRGESLPGMPVELYEVFPDVLIDSELGEIPKGWMICSLNDAISFSNGYAFSSKDLVDDSQRGVPVFKMGNIEKGGGFKRNSFKSYFQKEIINKIDKSFALSGDILMCMTDMKASMNLLGHTALILESKKYLVNQRVGIIRCRNQNKICSYFLYYLTNSSGFIDKLRARAHSGVQVNLSSEEIRNSIFVAPDPKVNLFFKKLCESIYKKIKTNEIQIDYLIQMRNSLLPQLITGKIRIKQAEKLIEEYV